MPAFDDDLLVVAFDDDLVSLDDDAVAAGVGAFSVVRLLLGDAVGAVGVSAFCLSFEIRLGMMKFVGKSMELRIVNVG